MFRPPLLMIVYAVLKMSLLFSIMKYKASNPRKEPGRTHTHTHFWTHHQTLQQCNNKLCFLAEI